MSNESKPPEDGEVAEALVLLDSVSRGFADALGDRAALRIRELLTRLAAALKDAERKKELAIIAERELLRSDIHDAETRALAAEAKLETARRDGAQELLDALKAAHLNAADHVKAGYSAAIIAASAFVALQQKDTA